MTEKRPVKKKIIPATTTCNANKKTGEGHCKRPAGSGTDHVGTGRCKLHGGTLNHPAPLGNQRARKHGIYAKLFNPRDLEEAAEMAGSVDTELAITRLQLANLLKFMAEQGETPQLEQVEDTVIIVKKESEEEAEERWDSDFEKVKKERAKTAIKCGEHYDPDDDDMRPEEDQTQESNVLSRRYVSKRRDFSTEYARLTKLIESLERTRASIPHQKAITEQVKENTKQIAKANNDDSDSRKPTGAELDSALLSAIQSITGLLPPIPE